MGSFQNFLGGEAIRKSHLIKPDLWSSLHFQVYLHKKGPFALTLFILCHFEKLTSYMITSLLSWPRAFFTTSFFFERVINRLLNIWMYKIFTLLGFKGVCVSIITSRLAEGFKFPYWFNAVDKFTIQSLQWKMCSQATLKFKIYILAYLQVLI